MFQFRQEGAWWRPGCEGGQGGGWPCQHGEKALRTPGTCLEPWLAMILSKSRKLFDEAMNSLCTKLYYILFWFTPLNLMTDWNAISP